MSLLKKLFFIIPLALMFVAFTLESSADPFVILSLQNRVYVPGTPGLWRADVVGEVPTGLTWPSNTSTLIINYNPAAFTVVHVDLPANGSFPSSFSFVQDPYADGQMAIGVINTGVPANKTGIFTICTIQFNVVDGSLYDNLSFDMIPGDALVGYSDFDFPDPCSSASGSDCWWSVNPIPQIPIPPSCAVAVPTGLGTTNITTTGATIAWAAQAGDRFDYQVVQGTDFSGALTTATTGTSINLTSLVANTPYNWRVRSVCISDAAQFSNWTVAQAFTTEQAAQPPAMPANLAPNNLCGQDLSLTLTWDQVAAATSYDVSFNNGAPVNISTNSYPVTGLSYIAGYPWKVRSVNANGSSDWATATFTTKFQPVTGLVPDGIIGVNNNPVMFNWSVIAGAQAYNIRYRVDGTSPWTEVDAIATNSYSVILLTNTVYDWEVMATATCGTNGNISDWSAMETFTTKLATPANLAPTGSGVTNTPILTWGTVAGAESYSVMFGTDPTFVMSSTYTPTTTSQAVPTLIPNTTYYWRVKGLNTAGNSSDWASVQFTTLFVINPPTLIAPANNAVAQPISVPLDWSDVAEATNYVVQWSYSNSPFTSAFETTVSASNYNAMLPYFQTQYFWRVKATNGPNESVWSPVFDFTTMQIPAPALSTPANGATVASLLPTLSWNAITGGSNVLYEAKILQGTDLVQSFAGLTGTALNVPADLLGWGTTYTWQVRAYQTGHSENWSTARTFTTPGIPQVELLTPAEGATFSAGSDISFTWSEIQLVAGYSVEVSTNSSFTGIVRSQDNLATTSYTLTGATSLTPGTYYWHARAVNGSVMGDWADFRTFNVITTAPLTVQFTETFGDNYCTSATNVFFGAPSLVISITNGSGNYSYQWTSTDGPVTRLNNAFILNPTLSRIPNSAPFPAQHFTLTVTDMTSQQVASATFYLNLPSSPTVVMIGTYVRKLRSAPAYNLNNAIASINGSTNFDPYTLLWHSPTDPLFADCVFPGCTPLASPHVTGLVRYELTAFNSTNGCDALTQSFYIFSYGDLPPAREGDENVSVGAGSILFVYPSIAVSDLNIDASTFQKSNIQLSVINVTGQEMMRIDRSGTDMIKETIDVSGLSSGMYFLIMKSDNGDQLMTKFVKQ